MCVRKRNVILDYIKLTNQIILNRSAKKVNQHRKHKWLIHGTKHQKESQTQSLKYVLAHGSRNDCTNYKLGVWIIGGCEAVTSMCGQPGGQKIRRTVRKVGSSDYANKLWPMKTHRLWGYFVSWTDVTKHIIFFEMTIYAIIFMDHDRNFISNFKPFRSKISSCTYCVKAVAYQYASHEISNVFRALCGIW